jgi:hypothetical protein
MKARREDVNIIMGELRFGVGESFLTPLRIK